MANVTIPTAATHQHAWNGKKCGEGDVNVHHGFSGVDLLHTYIVIFRKKKRKGIFT
jgi:hypothetical protein